MLSELFKKHLDGKTVKKLETNDFSILKKEIMNIFDSWTKVNSFANEESVFELINFFQKKFPAQNIYSKIDIYKNYSKYCNLLYYRVLCEVIFPFKNELDGFYEKLIRITERELTEGLRTYWDNLFLGYEKDNHIKKENLPEIEKIIIKNTLEELLTNKFPRMIAFTENDALKFSNSANNFIDQIIIFSLFSETKMKKNEQKIFLIQKKLLESKISSLIYAHKLIINVGALSQEFFFHLFQKFPNWKDAYEVLIKTKTYSFLLDKENGKLLNLLQKTIKSFWEKDYISFFAYSVPLVETTIRHFYIKLKGVSPNPHIQTNNLKINFRSVKKILKLCFESIYEIKDIGKKPMSEEFKKNILFTFQLLFSDRFGLNIRNFWAHGDSSNVRFKSKIGSFLMFALVTFLTGFK